MVIIVMFLGAHYLRDSYFTFTNNEKSMSYKKKREALGQATNAL